MAPPSKYRGSDPAVDRLIAIFLFFAMVCSIGYALIRWIEVWNTRPVSMYDSKAGRWRAHSLQGKPLSAKRHGIPRFRLHAVPPEPGPPPVLARLPLDPLLEQIKSEHQRPLEPTLEPTQQIGHTA